MRVPDPDSPCCIRAYGPLQLAVYLPVMGNLRRTDEGHFHICTVIGLEGERISPCLGINAALKT